MLYTYYDLIKKMNDEEIHRGFQRLGKVFQRSLEIQALTGSQVRSITKAIYGVGISPTHQTYIRNGSANLRETTLQRLPPLLFKVKYFDEYDNPHFYYEGENYKNNAKQLELRVIGTFKPNGTNEHFRPVPSNLPDYDYRCKTVKELVDIITGKLDYQSIERKTPTLLFG